MAAPFRRDELPVRLEVPAVDLVPSERVFLRAVYIVKIEGAEGNGHAVTMREARFKRLKKL